MNEETMESYERQVKEFFEICNRINILLEQLKEENEELKEKLKNG